MAVDIKTLDLDTILPNKGKVILGGKEYIVEPPKLKNLIELSKLAKLFQDGKASDSAAISALTEFKELLYPIIPALKDSEVDISLDQAAALLEFIMKLATPEDKIALDKAGITPTKKKIKPQQDTSD